MQYSAEGFDQVFVHLNRSVDLVVLEFPFLNIKIEKLLLTDEEVNVIIELDELSVVPVHVESHVHDITGQALVRNLDVFLKNFVLDDGDFAVMLVGDNSVVQIPDRKFKFKLNLDVLIKFEEVLHIFCLQ